MQHIDFNSLGHDIKLWVHDEPEHIGRVIRHNRQFYELDVLIKCRERHIPGTTIVDIGANIGNHTVFFGSILGARVHAFEPSATNRHLLELNVAANRLNDRITIHDCALGAESTAGRLVLLDDRNAGNITVVAGSGDIPIRTLDAHDIAGPVGLVKIDVEGSEIPVLHGAERLLRTWLPDLVIEIADEASFMAVLGQLVPLGYVVHGRYAWTPTYLFTAERQSDRLGRLMAAAVPRDTMN